MNKILNESEIKITEEIAEIIYLYEPLLKEMNIDSCVNFSINLFRVVIYINIRALFEEEIL